MAKSSGTLSLVDLENMFIEDALSPEELSIVNGGYVTGEFDEDGRVYVQFPSIVSGYSGFYNTEELEGLCTTYSSLASVIKSFVDDNVRSAVVTLYANEGKEIPQVVKKMLC